MNDRVFFDSNLIIYLSSEEGNKTIIVENKIIELRRQKVIIDSDVSKLYGVQTRDINKAVKNNPDKFPEGYLFELPKPEFDNLRWNISTTKFSKTNDLTMISK